MSRVGQLTSENNKEIGVSSKANSIQSLKPEDERDTKRQQALSVGTSPGHAEIARLAYEMYVERGSDHGHDVDDWLQAEHRLHREAAINKKEDI
jgi:hypothetical protein